MKQKTKTKNDNENPRYLQRVLLAAVVVLLVIFNYFYFRDKISSNNEQITAYTERTDPMEQYRNPAVAGLFYAADAAVLEREVAHYLQNGGTSLSALPKILIVPHAGYRYSAPAAAKAYRPLAAFADKVKTVLLLGPSHRVPVDGTALSSADYFATPLGRVPVDKDIVRRLADLPGFAVNNAAHRDEHSLEVQLPFLQKVLTDFAIVPMVYGDANPQETAEALLPLLQKPDTVLVVSADLSHYYPYETAKELDAQTAARIAAGRPEIDYHASCGAGGINSALILAEELHLRPQTLALINSGDTSGDKNRVVGYGAWAFTPASSGLEGETAALEAYAGAFGRELLRAARVGLEEAVLHEREYDPSRDDYDDALFDKGASFVTLEKNGALRGCIGSLYPRRAAVADVAANAYAAALNDGRFPPVAADELAEIKISVSLLTDFEPIAYDSEEDLLANLVAGTDGLVIRDGSRQGLFLPSVWRQLPDKKEFLNGLKLKAGMSPSYWSNAIKVYRFRTVEITEDEN